MDLFLRFPKNFFYNQLIDDDCIIREQSQTCSFYFYNNNNKKHRLAIVIHSFSLSLVVVGCFELAQQKIFTCKYVKLVFLFLNLHLVDIFIETKPRVQLSVLTKIIPFLELMETDKENNVLYKINWILKSLNCGYRKLVCSYT